jgi:hypothetical protein
VLGRLRELPPELRNAGLAAAAMVVTLVLPWYEQSYVPEASREFVQRNVSAFGAFSFVEAAVLLVAAGVLFLVWARSENRAFHLPGGDGTAIALAGGWAALLIIWRLFDEPDATGPSSDYSLQWGIFAALAAAITLMVMGLRVRAAHRPEPPNPAAEEGPPPSEPRPPRRRADPAAVTEVLGERPDWTGEPPEAPGRARRTGDEAPTRRLPDDDEAPTRRMRDDEEPTRRIEDDRLF